jgi:hypothetical protein
MQKIIIVCIVVLVVANILLIAKLSLGLEQLKSCELKRESLPCQAIPIGFLMNEPECTDKLLRTMNVTNVQILSLAQSNYTHKD